MHSWVLRNQQRLEAIYNVVTRPRRRLTATRESAGAAHATLAGAPNGRAATAARAPQLSVRVVVPAPSRHAS